MAGFLPCLVGSCAGPPFSRNGLGPWWLVEAWAGIVFNVSAPQAVTSAQNWGGNFHSKIWLLLEGKSKNGDPTAWIQAVFRRDPGLLAGAPSTKALGQRTVAAFPNTCISLYAKLFLWAACTLSDLILTAALWHRYCYHPQFSGRQEEALKLPKVL